MNYFYDAVADHGKTCIIIAHRLETLKKCDRIIVINHGQIVDEGSYDQLSRNLVYLQRLRANFDKFSTQNIIVFKSTLVYGRQ